MYVEVCIYDRVRDINARHILGTEFGSGHSGGGRVSVVGGSEKMIKVV